MKKLIISLVVIAAIAASIGAYYYTRPAPEPKVTTAAVSRGDVVETVSATGTFEAITSVTVGSQVSGTISELHADFNSIVTKGQVIARLDPASIETQVEQSQANLIKAQADVERLKVSLEDANTKLTRAQGLFKRQLVTQQDLDTAEVNVKTALANLRSSQAALTQAQAALNQNKVNLAHTIITAPIDGIVVSRSVDVGQTVAASFNAPTLFILAADLTKMKCTANIDEADVGRIRPGQNVRIRVDAYPTEEFTGTVSQVRLQSTTVQNVVTYGTVIEVPNNALKLKPGMTANVVIEVAKKFNVLRVPNAAIRYRPSQDVFAELGQPVPPELQRGAMRASGMGGFGQGSGGPFGAAPSPAASSATGGERPAGAGSMQRGPAAGGAVPSSLPRPSAGQQAQAGPGGMAGAPPSERGGAQGQWQGGGPGGAGGPGGPGGRGFDPNDPERRARMMERLQQMPPEERERFIARLKERGIDVQPLLGAPAGAKGAKPAARPQAAGIVAQGAQTIDSLFGPLPERVSFGRAWVYSSTKDKKELKSIRLRLGISDGTWTEVLDGALQPGQELVTGLTIGDDNKSSSASQSPLMQRGGPMGGPPMGGRR